MRTIETTIDIAAEPGAVWDVLTEFAAYPEWNPFIVAIEGPLEVGKTITARIKQPGSQGMTFRPRLLVVETNRELRWLGRFLVSGLFDGVHWFRIEETKGGVRFHHGERFGGLLVTVFGRKALDATAEGFEAMNAALKTRVEALPPIP